MNCGFSLSITPILNLTKSLVSGILGLLSSVLYIDRALIVSKGPYTLPPITLPLVKFFTLPLVPGFPKLTLCSILLLV